MRLSELFDLAIGVKLISPLEGNHREHRLRAAARAHRRLRRDPGDCGGDELLLKCLAVAEAVVGRGPGWIPEVQRIGCALARKAEGRE